MFDKIFEFIVFFVCILVGLILTPIHIAIFILNDISNAVEAAWIGLLYRICEVEIVYIVEDELLQLVMDSLITMNSDRYNKRTDIFKKIAGL